MSSALCSRQRQPIALCGALGTFCHGHCSPNYKFGQCSKRGDGPHSGEGIENSQIVFISSKTTSSLKNRHSEPAEESQQGVSTASSFDFAQDDNTLKNRHSEPAEESQQGVPTVEFLRLRSG